MVGLGIIPPIILGIIRTHELGIPMNQALSREDSGFWTLLMWVCLENKDGKPPIPLVYPKSFPWILLVFWGYPQFLMSQLKNYVEGKRGLMANFEEHRLFSSSLRLNRSNGWIVWRLELEKKQSFCSAKPSSAKQRSWHACRLRGYIRSFQGVRTSEEPSFSAFCWHSRSANPGAHWLQCGKNSLRTVKTRFQSRSNDPMFGLHLLEPKGPKGLESEEIGFFGGLEPKFQWPFCKNQ